MVLASVMALGCAPARAASPAIAASETAAKLALTAGYSKYEENVFPQDSENGGLVGVQAGLSVLTPAPVTIPGLPDLYTGLEYDFAAGFLRYVGNVQAPGYPAYQANDDDYYNTAIVRLGLGRPLGQGVEIIPYIAGGYQNWHRNISGPEGYGEFYQSGLAGAGIKLDIAAGPELVWSLSAESLAVLGGGISVPSKNFSGSFGSSAEERVSLDADYRFTDNWHAFAGLGITHYDYTGSKANAFGIYEPLSSTLQINSEFGIAYGF